MHGAAVGDVAEVCKLTGGPAVTEHGSEPGANAEMRDGFDHSERRFRVMAHAVASHADKVQWCRTARIAKAHLAVSIGECASESRDGLLEREQRGVVLKENHLRSAL